LAHQLQKLVWVFWAASLAGQTTRGFDHKQALNQKVECLICHAGQKESLTLSARHKGKRLKDFNHSFHLKMGNLAPVIAAAIDRKLYLGSPNKIDLPELRAYLNTQNPCQACHRGLEQSTGVLAKEHFPNMEDCLVCHNKIDAPFSCSTCHVEGANLKPANHLPDFLDRHTTGKLQLDKTTCAACHGRRFTCLGCH